MLLRCALLLLASLLVFGNEIENGTIINDDDSCFGPDWFKCQNGRCLGSPFVCDGEDDCGDNSDETNCPGMKTQVYGQNSSHIDTGEKEESVDSCSEPNWFMCGNGECISSFFRCDGGDECGDNSDESNCPEISVKVNEIGCSANEFECQDGTCVSLEKFCNAEDDCPDKSDEYVGCRNLIITCHEFRCNDGNCISNDRICDGFNDCADISDEQNCGNRTIPKEQCNNQTDHFLCGNGRCISLNQTCDGIDNCGDNSDESATECPNFEELCKKRMGCTHYCNETSDGLMCSCPVGHRLVDSQSCIDIDECSEDLTICDQHCINTPGSYNCTCDDGYELLDDLTTCRAMGGEGLLIYSRDEISRGSVISGVNLKNMRSFETDVKSQYSIIVNVWMDANDTYWTDSGEMNWKILMGKTNTIEYQRIPTNSHEKVIADNGLSQVEQIAVDFITGNIYFTDSGWKRIGVCQNDGEYCTLILCGFVNTPHGLVLNPMSGELFWSDIAKTPRISRAGMDGKDAKALVTEGLGSPKNLAIDYPNARLYWVDEKLRRIESVRLDGTDRREVMRTTDSFPFSIAIFENKIYWSNWNMQTIESACKYTGRNRTTVVTRREIIHGIHIHHSVLKPKIPNPCISQPCSELCLLAENRGYSCACSPDKELYDDRRTCKETEEKQHLIIMTENGIINYSNEIFVAPKMVASRTLKRITNAAYDSITGTILAKDEASNSILRIDPVNAINNTISIARTSSYRLGGMDFDEYGNNIYWSDPERRTIEILSLETYEKTIFNFKDNPNDILVIPSHGVMYVVFHSINTFHIDKLRMSDAEDSVQVVKGFKRPEISLAYDPESERVFWSNDGAHKIESISVEGFDRRVLRSEIRFPISLAVVGHNIYWIISPDRSKVIHYTDKVDRVPGAKSFFFSANYGEAVKLITIPKSSTNHTHPCRENNGRCSHVCLVSNSHSRVCACPPGMSIDSDEVSCKSVVLPNDKSAVCKG